MIVHFIREILTAFDLNDRWGCAAARGLSGPFSVNEPDTRAYFRVGRRELIYFGKDSHRIHIDTVFDRCRFPFL